jgi:hypothetical protein
MDYGFGNTGVNASFVTVMDMTIDGNHMILLKNLSSLLIKCDILLKYL